MLFLATFLSMSSLVSAAGIVARGNEADAQGYINPSSGTASTTQFNIGSEFGGGTSCGAIALPNGSKAGGQPGSGPGMLYAAINQLGFGANPGGGAGGPGSACGQCVKITPVSDAGKELPENALTFMLVDECPVSGGGVNCNQCKLSDHNVFGHAFHFDIASDAMNSQQFKQFYKGVTDGSNWKVAKFEKTACAGAAVAKPKITDWGCLQGCKNNAQASVC